MAWPNVPGMRVHIPETLMNRIERAASATGSDVQRKQDDLRLYINLKLA